LQGFEFDSPYTSFRTLLADLATLTRNVVDLASNRFSLPAWRHFLNSTRRILPARGIVTPGSMKKRLKGSVIRHRKQAANNDQEQPRRSAIVTPQRAKAALGTPGEEHRNALGSVDVDVAMPFALRGREGADIGEQRRCAGSRLRLGSPPRSTAGPAAAMTAAA
jgi:hypothetical protein